MGSEHALECLTRVLAALVGVILLRVLPLPTGINRVPIAPLYDAAFHHVQRCLTDGTPPPRQPRVEFAGEPPQVVRDAHGIAKGGIRLPQVEAPLATNTAIPLAHDVFAFLRGSSHPFKAGKARTLYGDKRTFLARFEAAAQRAVVAGVLMPCDVAPLVAEAAATWPG